MLRIGICDDNADQRYGLECAIQRVLEPQGVECSVYSFSGGEGLLRWWQSHAGELDLVFLDIEMGEVDGMETARRLRAADETLLLAFVTGYSDYVFDGYAVGALGYLLKPVQPDQLAALLQRALAASLRQGQAVFLCRNAEGLYRLPKNSILYFYSEGRRVTCVATGRTVAFYGKLNEVAESVGAGFVRIHQRYLVRAAAVDQVQAGSVLLAGQTLPISRAYQATAMTEITRAILEG